MNGKIVDAKLFDLRFVRLYISHHGKEILQSVAQHEYDYIFAYSLLDMGEIDGFSRENKWTQLLTLDGTTDDMFAELHKNNRYKIRRTFRDSGIEIVVDDSARHESYEFYKATKTGEGVTPDVGADFSSALWINAYHNGSLISSTSWFDSGEVLRAKHIVSTRKEDFTDTALVGRLTRRLFWEACVLGLERGYTYIDLGGLDPHDPDKRGVTEFKRSFGGRTVPIYVYRHATAKWQELTAELQDEGLTVV